MDRYVGGSSARHSPPVAPSVLSKDFIARVLGVTPDTLKAAHDAHSLASSSVGVGTKGERKTRAAEFLGITTHELGVLRRVLEGLIEGSSGSAAEVVRRVAALPADAPLPPAPALARGVAKPPKPPKPSKPSKPLVTASRRVRKPQAGTSTPLRRGDAVTALGVPKSTLNQARRAVSEASVGLGDDKEVKRRRLARRLALSEDDLVVLFQALAGLVPSNPDRAAELVNRTARYRPPRRPSTQPQQPARRRPAKELSADSVLRTGRVRRVMK